jgi:hypothetical protein
VTRSVLRDQPIDSARVPDPIVSEDQIARYGRFAGEPSAQELESGPSKPFLETEWE